MATQIQTRRGTAAEHASFTGAVGEITVVTDDSSLRVHDGSTVGGTPVSGGASASGPVLLQTIPVSSQSTIEVKDVLTSAYDRYRIQLINVVTSIGSHPLHLQVSDDNGATWKTGSSDYASNGHTLGGSLQYQGFGGSANTIQLTEVQGEVLDGYLEFSQPDSATRLFSTYSTISHHLESAYIPYSSDATGMVTLPAFAVNAVRFTLEANLFVSGTVKVYGIV
jgi:hypothetical protein